MCIAGGGEQHHRADHGGVQHEHDGGVDRVIEICFFDGGVAFAEATVIARLRVVLEPEGAQRAQVVQRLGHLTGNGCDGAAIFKLGCEHSLLHAAREGGQQRQHEPKHQRKAGIFHGDDRENGDDAAGVCRH